MASAPFIPSRPRPTPIGEMDRRLTLLKPTFATDANTGARTATFAAQGPVWAKVKALASREQYRARSVQLDTTHTITIRWRADLDETWQCQWSDGRGTRTGKITGVVETIRRVELELSVTVTR